MPNIEIVAPTRRETRRVVGREFVHLPPVDPAFADVKGLRRLFMRHVILPTNYMQLLQGALLKVDGETAAYLYARSRPAALRIDALATEPEHRRKGYAGRLLGEARKWAVERDLGWLSAHLTPENEPGRTFFEKHGFRAYRPHGWRTEDPAGLPSAAAEGLRPLAPDEVRAAYARWMARELEQGDAPAKPLVEAEYFEAALYPRGRHWALVQGGQEVGYLRLSGLRRGVTAFLALEQGLWASPQPLAWLAAALAEWPFVPARLLVDMASGGHHAAAAPIMEASGFEVNQRPRYLVFKRL
ncbi:MAG: GNAT family N-acetyltransferase [Chloroflexi bacterium]|nr:GNAT family N-acetyltransferase [Chloroflexota bacterium]